MKADYAALVGRMSQSLMDLDRVVDRAELLMKKAKVSGDDGFLDGVALNLHGFYAGVERIFEDIARTVERSAPSGSGWHYDLLLQMAADVSSIRPPVITSETRHCLDEYRGFRHVVRNVYTFNLRFSSLEYLCERLRLCFRQVKRDLQDFSQYLNDTIAASS
jgi:hypothetical protein